MKILLLEHNVGRRCNDQPFDLKRRKDAFIEETGFDQF